MQNHDDLIKELKQKVIKARTDYEYEWEDAVGISGETADKIIEALQTKVVIGQNSGKP